MKLSLNRDKQLILTYEDCKVIRVPLVDYERKIYTFPYFIVGLTSKFPIPFLDSRSATDLSRVMDNKGYRIVWPGLSIRQKGYYFHYSSYSFSLPDVYGFIHFDVPLWDSSWGYMSVRQIWNSNSIKKSFLYFCSFLPENLFIEEVQDFEYGPGNIRISLNDKNHFFPISVFSILVTLPEFYIRIKKFLRRLPDKIRCWILGEDYE